MKRTDRQYLMGLAEARNWTVAVIDGWKFGKPALKIFRGNQDSANSARLYVRLGVNDQITYLSIEGMEIRRNKLAAARAYMTFETSAIVLVARSNMEG